MAAIAGIAAPRAEEQVQDMLARMAHRGPMGSRVQTVGPVTLGVSWPPAQPGAGDHLLRTGRAEDRISDSHYAWARPDGKTFMLARDPLGVSPLYYGRDEAGRLCFSSEFKGLAGLAQEIHEMPAGSQLNGGQILQDHILVEKTSVDDPAPVVAAGLRERLEKAVAEYTSRGVPFGAWLSGGLDSSALAALARRHTETLHTFAAGFSGAPDLEAARLVARHIGSTHHEIIPSFDEIVQILPQVIYHLESFDALLVRSSLMNFLVAQASASCVPAVFSGEGGDELFAGYSYLSGVSLEDLPGELVDITNRLHNTALQRVDRSAAAHGLVAYVAFLNRDVVDYALSIPAKYKIVEGLEKWILRQAVSDLLPESIVLRKKAKFWEGAGVEKRLADYTGAHVSDSDFHRERRLPNGIQLNTKEELYYYRIFEEHFGRLEDLTWVGRTKGAPVQ